VTISLLKTSEKWKSKMPIQLIEAKLPWTGSPVRQLLGARDRLARHLTGDALDYLPSEIDLYADLSVKSDSIERLVNTASKFLVKEMAIREGRIWRLLRTGLCSEEEVDEIIKGQTHKQKWALYYSEDGGLPPAPTDPRSADSGTVPCSAMRNHGVSWRRHGQLLDVWLVTAPKSGQDWDMDSDIGHESAHAAFAPVPLFVQSAANSGLTPSLIDVDSSEELEPDQVARLLYFCSELAVVGIRGENRRTYTCLPIADPEELSSFLRLANELFPDIGFDRAQRTFKRVRGNFDLDQSDAVFDLTTPVLRILPKLNEFVDVLFPPTAAVLQKLTFKVPTAV
jgi:hypothetical protein